MALITSTSDPALYASLLQKWENGDRPGWVIVGSTHYRYIMTSSGETAFLLVENKELYDSRSPSVSRSTSYSEIDG